MHTVTGTELLPERFHPRVEAGFMIKLFSGGQSVVAKAKDLSMAGLKLLSELRRVDDRVTIAIPLPGDREIVTQATVRRRSTNEVAVEFDQLDWEDMFALARFLTPRL